MKTYGDPANRFTLAIDEDGHYVPGVVANAQFIVAQSILDGTLSDSPELQTVLNTITQGLLNWVQSSDGVYEPKFVCGGDSMASSTPSSSVLFHKDVGGSSMFFVVTLFSHSRSIAKHLTVKLQHHGKF